jgi:hypothetical protein
MSCLYRIGVVFWLFTGIIVAQATGPSDQETIRQLVQQVRELQQKVAALEGKASQPAQASAAPAVSAETPAVPVEESAAADSLFRDLHEVHGIQWRGFGEVNYKVLDQRRPELGAYGFVPGSAGNFFTGDFDLFLTSKISEKASVLSEIVIGEDDAQSFNVDLERVLFKYDYNDHLRLSMGRYHTGIGYYNTAFHSGKWLQTEIGRAHV